MGIEKLTELSNEIAEQKKKLAEFAKTEGRDAIGAAFAPLFEPPTNLVRIEWTQYTPHFNDGDACVFSVHEPTLVADIEGQEREHESYWLKSTRVSDYRDQAVADIGQPAMDRFLALWPIPGAILKAVFGDHVKVTITKDEVTVEEYEHD
jgi:hypothetical protein